MQTLDEVLELYVRTIQSEDELQKANDGVVEAVERNTEILMEICENKQAQELVEMYFDVLIKNEVPPLRVLMSLFAHGVVVGMAMEKGELKDE